MNRFTYNILGAVALLAAILPACAGVTYFSNSTADYTGATNLLRSPIPMATTSPP